MAPRTSRQQRHGTKAGVQLALGLTANQTCEIVPPREARGILVANHYTHSFPGRWSLTYRIDGTLGHVRV